MTRVRPFFLGSLAASTQSCWKSRGKFAPSPTRYLQLNPVCPRLPGLKWRGLSGSPPAASWTISMCPHPGQLLLLTNYRLCNPVTHQGFGSCGNRQGFQGRQRLGQGQTTAEQVFTNTRASGHKMVFNVQGFSKLLWLTGKRKENKVSV